MDTLIAFVLGNFIGAAISIFLIAIFTRGKEADAYSKGYEHGYSTAYNKNLKNNERGQ